eukprot:scaffold179723_cov15-Prasinocladus_malaysianus.AAC.1
MYGREDREDRVESATSPRGTAGGTVVVLVRCRRGPRGRGCPEEWERLRGARRVYGRESPHVLGATGRITRDTPKA